MRIAVVSLRFAPGHVAHLRAFFAMFRELGCEVRLFLDPPYEAYIGDGIETQMVPDTAAIMQYAPDAVISYNIAQENIRLAKRCKKEGVPFFYILHEPVDSIRSLFALKGRMPRRIAANLVNYLTSRNAFKVVLASENGRQKYEKYMRGCNRNIAVFPLIFDDEYDPSLMVERKYFSFIGGFTEVRGSAAFLSFVEYAVTQRLGIRFMIATRSGISDSRLSDVHRKAIEDGSLVIFSGRPMTTEEINLHYRESICVWNAYIDSTQSGVLPNALMQGAPVIVGNRGDSTGVVTDGQEGCFISIPHRNEEIHEAYRRISGHIGDYEERARARFLKDFFYRARLETAREVFEISEGGRTK